MSAHLRFSFCILSIVITCLCSGCTELFFLFGPGGIFGPGGTGGIAGGGGGGLGGGTTIGTTTTQPAAIAGPVYTSRQLDPLLEHTAGARVIVVADMNRDGLNDFVSGSAESQPVQIHLRIPNSLDFTTLSIAGEVPISIMYDVQVADFDQDGRLDVAVLVNNTGLIPVSGAAKRGAVVLLFAPPDPADQISWVQVVINATFVLPNDSVGLTDFAIADMDGTNGPDIVLGSNEVSPMGNVPSKHIYLFRNPGSGLARTGSAWLGPDFTTTFPITTDAPPFKALEVADIDQDGDIDVVGTFPTALSSNIRWMVNPLVESGAAAVASGNWTEHIIGEQRQLSGPDDAQNPGADFLDVGDIDGDGDIDVASVHEDLGVIQWFANPGPGLVLLQAFPWNVFTLGQVNTGISINQMQLVDMDLNSSLDCFITADGNMVGFERLADVQDYWQPFTIVGTNPIARIGTCAFDDVDGNGLLDIIAPMDREGITLDNFLILLRVTP